MWKYTDKQCLISCPDSFSFKNVRFFWFFFSMNSDCLLLAIKAALTYCMKWVSTWWPVQNSTCLREVTQSVVTVPRKKVNLLLKVPSHCIEFARIFFCPLQYSNHHIITVQKEWNSSGPTLSCYSVLVVGERREKFLEIQLCPQCSVSFCSVGLNAVVLQL